MKTSALYVALGLLATTGTGMAQAQLQDTHPWRAATDADQAQAQAPAPPPYQPNLPPYQNPNAYPNQYPQQDQTPPPNMPPMPAHLTLKAGTFVTVRANQWLSSDNNHPGDSFTASLAQPLIVDGVVVAERGQTIGGKVTDAQKAGRVEGTSRLGVTLTDVTLSDGATVPIQSTMIHRNGPTSVGNDVAAVAGTTALGAAIGAAADWGRGAAIGAGAGAAAGLLGVLLTRGHPTVIYPESVMTFRIEAPVDISTERAPQAFRFVDDRDYPPPAGQRPPPRPAYGAYGAPAPYTAPAAPYAAPAPYPYPVPAYGYYGYAYPYRYAYPYYGGVYFGFGGRYYGGYYRGYHR